MKQVLSITRIELEGYFNSTLAYLCIGLFLVTALFAFFTADRFFTRGIADLMPLFHWLPILLLGLAAALTMKQWSNEQRTGTLVVLLTLPISIGEVVLGKFLAVTILIALALVLTLPLPITVAQLGYLDWSIVSGGYALALLMAAAYSAVGLFISSRTDSQIVAMFTTIFVGGLLYLVGTSGLTSLVDERFAAIMRAVGTGSHFQRIGQGILDLRDLVYYLSLTGLFLVYNVLSLQSKGWGHGLSGLPFRLRQELIAALLAVNLVLVNVWLYPISWLCLDTTQLRELSLSTTVCGLWNNAPFIQNGGIWSTAKWTPGAVLATGKHTPALKPSTAEVQSSIEIVDYTMALLPLVLVAVFWRWRYRQEKPMDITVNMDTPTMDDFKPQFTSNQQKEFNRKSVKIIRGRDLMASLKRIFYAGTPRGNHLIVLLIILLIIQLALVGLVYNATDISTTMNAMSIAGFAVL